jgi:hypothetical protein
MTPAAAAKPGQSTGSAPPVSSSPESTNGVPLRVSSAPPRPGGSSSSSAQNPVRGTNEIELLLRPRTRARERAAARGNRLGGMAAGFGGAYRPRRRPTAGRRAGTASALPLGGLCGGWLWARAVGAMSSKWIGGLDGEYGLRSRSRF